MDNVEWVYLCVLVLCVCVPVRIVDVVGRGQHCWHHCAGGMEAIVM